MSGSTAREGQRRWLGAKLSSRAPQLHKQASRGDIAGMTPHLVAAAPFAPTGIRSQVSRKKQRPPVAISWRESQLLRHPAAPEPSLLGIQVLVLAARASWDFKAPRLRHGATDDPQRATAVPRQTRWTEEGTEHRDGLVSSNRAHRPERGDHPHGRSQPCHRARLYFNSCRNIEIIPWSF